MSMRPQPREISLYELLGIAFFEALLVHHIIYDIDHKNALFTMRSVYLLINAFGY